MAKIGRWGTVLVFGVGVALASSSARADYVISVVDPGGLSALTVDNTMGDVPVNLDVVIASDAGDVHDNFGFFLNFSKDGLLYDSYELVPDVYVTGGSNDFSSPATGGAIASPILFSALTEVADTKFDEGTLISFGLTVPMGYEDGDVMIDVAPDWFGDGWTDIPSYPGEPFMLTVVPEPATLALLALGGVAVLRRRRK